MGNKAGKGQSKNSSSTSTTSVNNSLENPTNHETKLEKNDKVEKMKEEKGVEIDTVPKGLTINPEQAKIYRDLHEYFLSNKACTEKEQKKEEVPIISDDEITRMFRENVPGVDQIYNRTHTSPVTVFIISTYHHGIPLFSNNQAVQQHTISALRYILYKAKISTNSKLRQQLLTRLTEAFTSCQMEQGRVIDSLFGSLSGRDKNFREQVLSVVDLQKEQVLNQIVNKLNPNAWKTGDDNPQGQVPHLQSSYCKSIGRQFGLRGVQAAEMDKDAVRLNPTRVKEIEKEFKSLFSIDDIINMFVDDVNQQSQDAERLINRDTLFKWAGDPEINNGFKSDSVFYDSSTPKDYNGAPTPENQYQPYLNKSVACDILYRLFLFCEKTK